MIPFDKDYFQSANYTNYLDRQEKYSRTAEEIFDRLKTFGLLNKKSSMLDYGCAVGFLSHGFRELGIDDIDSYDISEWAKEQARMRGCRVVESLKDYYNIGIFLDVLEHIDDAGIDTVFHKTRFGSVLVRIPCSVPGQPNKFYLEVSRRDPTHINCKTPEQWITKFRGFGYNTCLPVTMNTIYNSPGCFCAILV
jgi:hypothetical protein